MSKNARSLPEGAASVPPDGRKAAESFRDTCPARIAIGLGLALLGGLVYSQLPQGTNSSAVLALFGSCVALAALLGGMAGGLACLIASALTIWGVTIPTGQSLVEEEVFLAGGAIVSAAAGLTFSQQRHRIEESLRSAESGLRLAVEAAGIGTFEANLIDNTCEFNGAERAIFGFAEDAQITATTIDALVHEDDREARSLALQKATDPESDGIYRLKYRIRRASDGAERWVSAFAQVYLQDGRIARVIGAHRDITDEMGAERLLQEKARLAEQLTGLAEALPGAIYTYKVRNDGSSYMPYSSPKIEDVTGFPPELLAVDLSPMAKCVHIDDLMLVYAAIARAANQVSPSRVAFRYYHPRKGLVWLEWESAPHFDANGEPVWHGYLQDVTDRTNAAVALEASEKRLRAVIDGADQAIFTIDPGGLVTSMNAAGQRMFGYPAEEIVGASADLLLSERSRGRRDGYFLNVQAQGEQKIPRVENEAQGRRKDGSAFPMFVSIAEVRYADTHLFVGFARDLTEQRRIEARVRQMNDERLATLETMAAGLAHEVNQPLAAGAMFLGVARRLLTTPGNAGRVEHVLDKAGAQILRAGRIITRVREFSTRGEPDKTFQNLHELIASVGKAMSEDEKLANYRLLLQLNAENDRVIADRMQISQVLVNLIRNAAQAMHSLPSQDIIVSTATQDRSDIRIRVIDNGVGMSEETRNTLFEPFKSTKPTGMGVGLSISRAIVEAHFGRIWAEPNPGGGSIFNFSLPVVERDAP